MTMFRKPRPETLPDSRMPDVTRTAVLHPVMPGVVRSGKHDASYAERSPASCLEEAVGLARAINLAVVYQEIIKIREAQPSTLFGKGVVEKIGTIIAENKISLVVVDHALTPVQQRNLERAWKAKVIDRTGLILEIFGARAHTKEGKLQVELAALTYQRSRLVRAWTHLERQRGGFGFTGGPGETQIELDRRMLEERIVRIKQDLEKVRMTRKIQRRARERVPYPVIALVGYTNAGKSTLFNRLTSAKVFVKDLLFATLDTTMRAVDLPSGQKIIVSDTVGFISELPTALVAAFRATLEEVEQAEIILHVRDISQPYAEAEKSDVNKILSELGINTEKNENLIEVLNKIDLLREGEKESLLQKTLRDKTQIMVSAVTGEGVDALLNRIDSLLGRARKIYKIRLKISDGKGLAWLYEHAAVKERMDMEDEIIIKCEMEAASYERFKSLFSSPRKRRKAD